MVNDTSFYFYILVIFILIFFILLIVIVSWIETGSYGKNAKEENITNKDIKLVLSRLQTPYFLEDYLKKIIPKIKNVYYISSRNIYLSEEVLLKYTFGRDKYGTFIDLNNTKESIILDELIAPEFKNNIDSTVKNKILTEYSKLFNSKKMDKLYLSKKTIKELNEV